MTDRFSNYPKRIKVSTKYSHIWYTRLPDLYAIHGKVPAQYKDPIIAVVDPGNVVVCRGQATDLPSVEYMPIITPVYGLQENGPPAVPTGLVLVRFADHVRAATQDKALEKIDYVIDKILPYAPQAVWVKSAHNDIAAAILGISRLEALAEVVNVEPQMLTESARRTATVHPL